MGGVVKEIFDLFAKLMQVSKIGACEVFFPTVT